MKNIIESLKWRYAVKSFDPEKKISEEKLVELMETIRLSPSSYGVQPWKFVIIKNPELRAKIKGVAYGQDQVVSASHLIVFAVDKNFSVERFVNSVAEKRGVPADSLKDYRGMIEGFLSSLSDGEKMEWATRQVYLALGIALASAAVMEIDACPMEGFDPKAVDEILGFEKLGLESRVLLPIGYRSADDKHAFLPKVRYPREEVFIEIN